MTDLLESQRDAIAKACSRHGVRRLDVFGSALRDDFHPGESDVDLLVDVVPGRSFLDLVAFWQELEEQLGRRVDVVTDGGMSPYLKDKIYAEAIPL